VINIVCENTADVLQLEYSIDLTKEGHTRGYQSHDSHKWR